MLRKRLADMTVADCIAVLFLAPFALGLSFLLLYAVATVLEGLLPGW